MTTWTTAAREELERYFERVRGSLRDSGADSTEVIDDLRRHLENEATSARLAVVTEDDVRRFVGRLGAPDAPMGQSHPAPPPAVAPAPPAATPRRRPGIVWLVLGVILPLITLVAELATGMCAGAFFDPVPSVWHLVLVLCVPVANGLAWRACAQGIAGHRRWLSWANGAATAVALFYAVLYLPLLLPGLIAVFMFGWGLLPWTPALALVATVALRSHLRRLDAGPAAAGLPGWWRGCGVAVLALVCIDGPVWMTRHGLHLAASEEAAEQRRGLRWLRAVGNEDVLLRACYGRSRGAVNTDVVGWLVAGGRDVPAEQAREIYYRVTGRAFNSVPAPKVRTARGSWAALDDWTWDSDQGGQQVGGRLKGLTAQSSRLDAVIEPDAALYYAEWTLEFRNVASRAQEARAQIRLPPGGVVSRLTLWVNGEEREAAFAGRSHVRQAYERVAIRQRRDPVLVTTSGPDRVLVQCFPVPADGGTMKIRLGITAPLELTGVAEGRLHWPCFLERNFSLPAQFRHALWVESAGELVAGDGPLRAEQPRQRAFAVRGTLSEPELMSGHHVVGVRRNAQPAMVHARAGQGPVGFVVTQRLLETTNAAASRVVLVVDDSATMKAHRAALSTALGSVSGGLELAVVVAGDEPTVLEPGWSASPADRQAWATTLGARPARGGQDNVPALERAWDLAASQPGAVILWVHGPQPVKLSSTDSLRQRFERRPAGPVLLDLQTEPGPNRILESLDGIVAVRAVSRSGDLPTDLGRWFASQVAGTRSLQLVRERRSETTDPVPAGSVEVSAHVIRLWASDEVSRLRAARRYAEAIELAGQHQIVTPVSGAVVLETEQQYRETGLEPADPTTVPAIPEPETALLLSLGVFALWFRRRRPQSTAA